MMKQKIYVNFIVNTDEAIRLECQNGYNRAEKELFIVDGEFYFYYAINRNAKTQTISLREISKEEYLARKSELLNARPASGANEWVEGDNVYNVKIFHNGIWKRNVPAEDCIFLTENKVKELMDSVVSQVATQRNSEVTLDRESKAEYARRCGSLANKLELDFVNVLRIGHDIRKLTEFKKTYQLALDATTRLSLKEKRELYTQLNANRKSKKEAIDKLGIKYFDADINLMDFSKLMDSLHEELCAYTEESINVAIRNIQKMDRQEQLSIYERLRSNSREIKRQTLSELGVKVELIEFKRYPFDRIKHALTDILGLPKKAPEHHD